MNETPSRYPGAQPFGDNEISRLTFFGREAESLALADQILANRLTVVYAKSGLGKTSLLNAGVAARLREAGNLPLLVRVNDTKHGPLLSVFNGARAESERQQVEYVEGDTASLWTFFKTVEFWRKDLLLAPVLIIDQFEELFTLQTEGARDAFLTELGYLVRGVPPPIPGQTLSGDSDAPPSVRIVLCLREDFLGILEEAADRIPQILAHRFRLTPLTVQLGAEAMRGPASVEDPSLKTRAFQFDPQLVTSILDHLSARVTQQTTATTRFVEPFHLQLICQHIERVVSKRQEESATPLTVRLEDIGGAAALTGTLQDFYMSAVRDVPGRRRRRVVRRLCEDLLISAEGRRLSLEEREIQRQLKLPEETLRSLVNSRLLRSDQRSDSTYYELSHDALVEPILGSTRMKSFLVSAMEVVAGLVLFGLTVLAFVAVAIGIREADMGTSEAVAYFVTIFFTTSFLWYPAFRLARMAAQTYKRFHSHRRPKA